MMRNMHKSTSTDVPVAIDEDSGEVKVMRCIPYKLDHLSFMLHSYTRSEGQHVGPKFAFLPIPNPKH